MKENLGKNLKENLRKLAKGSALDEVVGSLQ
jgi:hypothetical protein